MTAAIVGREAELAQIEAWCDATVAGLVVVLIEGDPGIGKTTVFRTAVERARERSRVLLARPAESERELPFAALGDLLDGVGSDAIAQLPTPQRRALEIALLRAEPEGSDVPYHPRAAALGLLGVLRALSEAGPVLVAVDDVQWLDPASAAALAFALRRLGPEPVAVLAAQRAEESRAPPLDLSRPARDDRLRRLPLGPLELDALARVIREHARARVPRPGLKRIHRLSGGNPFVAIELARAPDADRLALDAEQPLPVTTSLRRLAHRRLGGLSDDAREAVLVVSALARPRRTALEAWLGEGLRRGVAECLEARALDLDADGDRLRLAHPVLGSVLYADAPPERRRALHQRLAGVSSGPEERARHLALAAERPDLAVAAALDDAARTARFRGALDAAASLSEQAVRLTPPERAPEARRRTIEAAEHHFDAGALARAQSLLHGLAAASSPGRGRADVLVRLAEVTFACDGWTAATEPLARALAEAGDDLELHAHVERRLAWGYHLAGDLRTAERHAQRAAELADELGEPGIRAATLANRCFIDALRGRGLRHDAMRHAVELEQAAARIPILERPSWVLAVMLRWAGPLAEARSILERLDAECRERGDDSSRPFTLNILALVACSAGELDRAEQLAREALEIALQTGQDTEQAFTTSTGALVDALLGRTELARARVDEGLALARRTGNRPADFNHRAVLGFLELSQGDTAAAAQVLDPLVRDIAGAGFADPIVFPCAPDAIEALIGVGRLDRAEAQLARLERAGSPLAPAWAAATAGRCRGLLVAAGGDPDGAVATLEAALVEHERLDDPFERGRTLLALGTVHRRRRRRGAAREALEEAGGIFAALPAPLWVQRVGAEMRRLGGRRGTRWELTPTERRVAELVAAGHTNRETADALFLSPKTVEWNLSKVYRKLGVRSRTQLAQSLGDPVSKSGGSPGSRRPRPA